MPFPEEILQQQQNRFQILQQEQQQEQRLMQPQQEHQIPQHQHQQNRYERFFHRLRPVPAGLPVAEGLPPQEENLGYKERHRRERVVKNHQEAYHGLSREMSKHPRLMTEAEVKDLPLFQTRQGQTAWANETLPHSRLTREQTMRQILNENDFSNFENLDAIMRNVVASKALFELIREFPDYAQRTTDGDIDAVCRQIQAKGEGVSALLNPALRLGLSLAQKSQNMPQPLTEFCRKLDEAMSTAVMTATLTHIPDHAKVAAYFHQKGVQTPAVKAEQAIRANQAQQIQIAKRLLLMQLSKFHKIKEDGSSEPWDKSMAVALSHCSRVVLTLPKQENTADGAQQQKRMWRSIMTIGGENPAQDNYRASSTHSIIRRKVNEQNGELATSKEKKRLFNLVGQRGMNCAIGGLGNAGISGKTLCNDGSCGHFYSMYKEADTTHFGAMLMGLESDAAGVTNQMGHTHDIHATPEQASSLGGQRLDEIGIKYGGRQCDLTELSADEITAWMEALEAAMLAWQAGTLEGGMESYEAISTMQMLSGKQMDANALDDLWETILPYYQMRAAAFP